jgi:hypothetical protein
MSALVGFRSGGHDTRARRFVVADGSAFTRASSLDDHGVTVARHELFHGFRGGDHALLPG